MFVGAGSGCRLAFCPRWFRLRGWLIAICCLPSARWAQEPLSVETGAAVIRADSALPPSEYPREIQWPHASAPRQRATLGLCDGVPPFHIANCHPLASGSVLNDVWGCTRILQQYEAQGADTLSVHGPTGFCQVSRCGPEGGSPIAQTGGGKMAFHVLLELKRELQPAQVYSFRCAEPRALIHRTSMLSSFGGGANGDMDKQHDYWTTSRKFKQDLREYFGPLAGNWTAIELGSYHGYTTSVLSELFQQVIALDASDTFLMRNSQVNRGRGNILYVRLHTRLDELETLKHNEVQVVMVDAEHDYESVRQDVEDILRVFSRSAQYLIFDDYATDEGVRQVIKELVSEGRLQILGGIGYSPPWKYYDKVVNHWEGVVCKILMPVPSEGNTAGGAINQEAATCMMGPRYYWLAGSVICNQIQLRFDANGDANTTRGFGRWRRDPAHPRGIFLDWPSPPLVETSTDAVALAAGSEPKLESWYLGFDDNCSKFAAVLLGEVPEHASGVDEEVFLSMTRRIFVSVNHEFCNSANECTLRQTATER